MADKTEKVNWVIPLSKGLALGKAPYSSDLREASTKKGIRLENMKSDDEGQIFADVYQDVVEGMPAPRNNSSKDQK